MADRALRCKQRKFHAGCIESVPGILRIRPAEDKTCENAEKSLPAGRKGTDKEGIPKTGPHGKSGRKNSAGTVHGSDCRQRSQGQRTEIFYCGAGEKRENRSTQQRKVPENFSDVRYPEETFVLRNVPKDHKRVHFRHKERKTKRP